MDQYSIYPKQFNKNNIPVDKNRCFVLMPFHQNYDELYGNIKTTLNDMGIVCNRDDEISGSMPFMNKVITEIIKSRYIIVVLTDYRPNVLYELGIAHTIKDLQNVMLILEKNSNIANELHNNASDLSHLTYIEYQNNNKFDLIAKIREFINSNRYVSDFYEILNIKGLTRLTTESDSFEQFVQASLGNKTILITNILSHQEFTQKECSEICYCLESLIKQCIENGKISWIDGLVMLYSEVLISGESFKEMEVICNNFITRFLSQFSSLSEEKVDNILTNFSIRLAENKTYPNIVIPYIIDYFSRSKSTKIDLNRYKLESFLMSCNYKEVDDAIIGALMNNDRHIREHMADIVGEKKLFSAKDILIMSLKKEQNYYSAASEIEAIGKLCAIEGKFAILDWCKKNKKDIIISQNQFVLKHARNALIKLAIEQHDSVLTEFNNEFEEILKSQYNL